MTTTSTSTAISFGDHKQAALFFDQIWPMHSMDSVPNEIHDITLKIPPLGELTQAFGNLLSQVSRSPLDGFTIGLREFALFDRVLTKLYPGKARTFGDKTAGDPITHLMYLRAVTGAAVFELATLSGYRAVPVFPDEDTKREYQSTQDYAFLPPPPGSTTDKSRLECLRVRVSNLKLIATTHAEWAQVQEVRADSDSIKSLRDLRILFRKEYKDLSAAEIQDDIDARIDNYGRAASKHGFELTTKCIDSILDQKSLVGVASIAAIAACIGGPPAATATALAGAVLHTAKATFEVATDHFRYRADQKQDEIAYIIQSMAAVKEHAAL